MIVKFSFANYFTYIRINNFLTLSFIYSAFLIDNTRTVCLSELSALRGRQARLESGLQQEHRALKEAERRRERLHGALATVDARLHQESQLREATSREADASETHLLAKLHVRHVFTSNIAIISFPGVFLNFTSLLRKHLFLTIQLVIILFFHLHPSHSFLMSNLLLDSSYKSVIYILYIISIVLFAIILTRMFSSLFSRD